MIKKGRCVCVRKGVGISCAALRGNGRFLGQVPQTSVCYQDDGVSTVHTERWGWKVEGGGFNEYIMGSE